jgi:cation diffusion facilitator family transporter
MKAEDRKYGYFEGTLSIVVNTILFALKMWVGLASRSVAMVADAWHTLSDTMTSLTVIAGFWVSGRPRDKKHPFGHGRAELIAAIVISVLLGMVGVNFLINAVKSLLKSEGANFTSAGVIIFALSILIKEGLAQYSIWAGKKINSKALIADGWHHRSDAAASLLIVIGALLSRFAWWVDGVLGIIVSLLIIYTAVDLIKDAAGSLLGEEISPEAKAAIGKIAAKNGLTVEPGHHFHIHRYGDHTEVTMHLCFPEEISLKEAHEAVHSIENRAKTDLDIILTIHPEPISSLISEEESTDNTP